VILVSDGLQALLCGIALCHSAGAVAATEDEDAPDMEFLEYLGLWEQSDEEWLLLDEEEVAGKETRSDPVPEGEESTEKEDEG